MPKKSSKKPDPIAIALSELAIADRETYRAVRCLYKALLETAPKRVSKTCKFKIGNQAYKAKITPDQCKTILNAVNGGGDAVKAAIDQILGALNCQIVTFIEALSNKLGVSIDTLPTITTLLGCCIYDGGQTPSLSQAQCNQYNPIKWDSGHPDCTHDPLSPSTGGR